MAQQTDTVAAPAPLAGPGPGRAGPRRARLPQRTGLHRRAALRRLRAPGPGPPVVAIAVGAFQDSGHRRLHAVQRQDAPRPASTCTGSRTTLELSVITSIVPGIVGLPGRLRDLHGQARGGAAPVRDHRLRRVRQLRRGPAGVPVHRHARLAPAWSPAWLTDIGLNPYTHGFNLYTFSGIVVVYMYFQIPLMVLVILPALEGLRPAWREAAENLGARHLAVLALRRRPGAAARRSWAACCCCSAARSPPTPPPRR